MLRMQPHPQMNHHVPSPASCQPMGPSTSCAPSTSTASKPKLSLNTAMDNTKSRTFGKGTSLRIDTLTATTPTIINTFSNAYQQPKETGQETPQTAEQPSAVSSTSTTSTASLEAATVCPYVQHSHIKPALTNGHFIRIKPRNMSVAQRPLFPLRKSVSFKDPLSEEIHTVKFTFAHSDIDELIPLPIEQVNPVPTESPAPTPALEMPNPMEKSVPKLLMPTISTTPAAPRLGSPSSSPRLHRRSSPTTISPSVIGHKRDSSTSDSEGGDSCPQTPVAGRSKKRRWQWTLGPLPGYKGPELVDEDYETPQGSREGSVIGDDTIIMSPDA